VLSIRGRQEISLGISRERERQEERERRETRRERQWSVDGATAALIKRTCCLRLPRKGSREMAAAGGHIFVRNNVT